MATIRPIKVLHVFNSASGGAAMSTLELIAKMSERGVAACAVCHEMGTAADRQAILEATQGATLFTPLVWWNRKVRLPLWKRPLSAIKQKLRTGFGRSSTRRVAEFAVQQEVDLIHTNTLVTPEGGRAARKLGLPHVWHIRELVGPGQPYPLPMWGERLGRYLRDHASRMIANSHASAAPLKMFLPADFLQIVPNGIDTSRFRPRTDWHKNGPLVIGMVGNLTSQVKRHALFIQAAGKVTRELPLVFRIYGHDPSAGGTITTDGYVNELRRLVGENQLTERVRFSGFVAEPTKIMEEIDILVHPAEGESFGRIIVEAMAAAIPVVGVRGGGVGEIVVDEETGLLAAPGDAADLARQIERLARDPALGHRLGDAGRVRVEEMYSLASCAAGVFKIYEQALSRPVKKGW